MIQFLRRLFCRHRDREIALYGSSEDIYRCTRCGRLLFQEHHR